jgi:hypothetical protein
MGFLGIEYALDEALSLVVPAKAGTHNQRSGI